MAVDGTSAPGAKNFPLPVSPASGDPDQHSSRMRLQRQNSWLRPGRSAALALRSPLAAPALFRLPGHERIAIATGHSPTEERKTMRNIAEFTLIGRVGTIKQVGKTVRVSVCANYPFKDDKGQWKDDAHWNEVTIFTKAIQSYVSEHVSKGDLVHVRGRLRQSSFERDGQRVYTVDLIAHELGGGAKPGAPAGEKRTGGGLRPPRRSYLKAGARRESGPLRRKFSRSCLPRETAVGPIFLADCGDQLVVVDAAFLKSAARIRGLET